MQRLDRGVEVAMLLPQSSERSFQLPCVLFAKARRGRTPCTWRRTRPKAPLVALIIA